MVHVALRTVFIEILWLLITEEIIEAISRESGEAVGVSAERAKALHIAGVPDECFTTDSANSRITILPKWEVRYEFPRNMYVHISGPSPTVCCRVVSSSLGMNIIYYQQTLYMFVISWNFSCHVASTIQKVSVLQGTMSARCDEYQDDCFLNPVILIVLTTNVVCLCISIG